MNPIIDFSGSENNPMNSLHFYWIAYFKDNSTIYQFDEQGKEHLFKEVKEKFSELFYFALVHKSLPIYFIVDLNKGLIFYNNYKSIEIKEEKKNIRLICFRKRKVVIAGQLIKKNITIYHLGYQYLDKNENNRQIVLQIDENGNWILGD